MGENNPPIIKGVTAEEYPEFYEILEKLMNICKIKKIRIFIRPKLNNACILGKYIIIGKPILEKFTRDELEAIMAHEFSHNHLRHSLSSVFLGLIFLIPLIYSYLMYNPGDSFSALLFLVGIVIWICGIRINNWITLHQEISADILSIHYTQNPKALQKALIKLEINSLAENSSFLQTLKGGIRWVIFYLFGFTHPSVTERLQYLETVRIVEYPEN